MAKKKVSAELRKLLNKADRIYVRVSHGGYVNPLGPNGGDDSEFAEDDFFDGHYEIRHENVTLRKFIEKEFIQIHEPGERAYGFLDITFDEFESWVESLEKNIPVNEEVCNYDTIECYKIERVC